MKDLKKYELSFLPTMIYVRQVLEQSNSLSDALLHLINFSDGHFFTYLPKDVELSDIYQFERGGISSNTYLEVAKILLDKVNENSKISCIIDDVIRKPSDKNITSFGACSLFLNDEVYHLITKKMAAVEVIFKCLHETDAIWHSLAVLTEAHLNELSSSDLSVEKIQEICLMTRVLVVGAYDGEGYIFWEKVAEESPL